MSKTSSNVVSMSDERFIRDLKKEAWNGLDFNVDYSDVTRTVTNNEPALTDSISVGPTASKTIETLFASFGLPEQPKTWGELTRNIVYCKQLFLFAQDYESESCIPGIKEMADNWWPGWGERAVALARRDIAQLKTLHEAAGTFTFNAARLNNNPYRTKDVSEI